MTPADELLAAAKRASLNLKRHNLVDPDALALDAAIAAVEGAKVEAAKPKREPGVEWFQSPDIDVGWELEISAVHNGHWLDVWQVSEGGSFWWQALEGPTSDGCDVAHGELDTLDGAKRAAETAAGGGR
jgi:hypothetical protein